MCCAENANMADTRHCSTTCAYRLVQVQSRSVIGLGYMLLTLNTVILQLRWLYSLRERHLRNLTMRHLPVVFYINEANNIPNSSTQNKAIAMPLILLAAWTSTCNGRFLEFRSFVVAFHFRFRKAADCFNVPATHGYAALRWQRRTCERFHRMH